MALRSGRAFFALAGVVPIALSIGGCSSVPDFRPSKPVEEASSLSEAISLCAAYQIKGEQNGSGGAQPARAVVLVPWLRCFETVLQKSPSARDNEGLVLLFRSLSSRHDGAPTADARVIDWPQMNAAMNAATRHLIDATLRFAESDSLLLQRQLPDYWIFLADSGRLDHVATPGAAARADREALRREIEGSAGIPAGAAAESLPPRPLPLDQGQKSYCKRYLAYKSLLYNLQEIGEYKHVLEERTRDDVGNANEQAMRDRVNARFGALKKEAETAWSSLAEDLKREQARSSWFRNGYCVDQKPRRLKKSPS